jgi:hypothetical protein
MEELKPTIVKLERLFKKQARIMFIMKTCAENENSAYREYLSDFMTEYDENKQKISELEKDLGL